MIDSSSIIILGAEVPKKNNALNDKFILRCTREEKVSWKKLQVVYGTSVSAVVRDMLNRETARLNKLGSI